MECIAIRHVAFEDLGAFEPVLREAGFRIEYLQAGVGGAADGAAHAAQLMGLLR